MRHLDRGRPAEDESRSRNAVIGANDTTFPDRMVDDVIHAFADRLGVPSHEIGLVEFRFDDGMKVLRAFAKGKDGPIGEAYQTPKGFGIVPVEGI